jgi:hypothetical protein
MSGTILDALGGMGGLQQMAKELGVDEKTVAAGAAALLPAVMGGFKQQAVSGGGVESLLGMLGGMGGGGLLDQVLSPQPTQVAPGQDIIAQVLGGQQGAQAVAGHAAAQSGIPTDLIMKMLPMVAMAAAGFMAKSANAGAAAPAEGGLGGLLSQVAGMLGGGQPAAAAGAGGGLGGIAAMLDMDGDGNPLDDILGMAQKMTR